MDDFRRKSSLKIELTKQVSVEKDNEIETFSPELNRKSREMTKGHVSVFNRLDEIAEISSKTKSDLKEKLEAEKEEELKKMTFKPTLKTK